MAFPSPRPLSKSDQKLKATLDAVYTRHHRRELLSDDPLVFAHRFRSTADREVAALIAAAFASGNIKSIMAVLESIFAVLGKRPAKWLAEHEPEALRDAFAGVQHRWVRAEDIAVLMARLGATLRGNGTLGGLWHRLDDPAEATILPSLGRFVESIRAADITPLQSRARVMTRAGGRTSNLAPIDSILLTSPEKGSACKRMNLFLRWVVRPDDGIDLGLWTPFVSPSRLVMPVDVHVMRLCARLRLTRRRVPDLRAASEITERLRRIAPEDPCRYDFSMVRAGILGNESGPRRRAV